MKILLHFSAALLALALSACSENFSLDMDALSLAQINNFRAPESGVLSTGQPTSDQLSIMAEAGVKHIINLRPPAEDVGFDERARVEALGMTYHNIPVSVGEGGINSEKLLPVRFVPLVEGIPETN